MNSLLVLFIVLSIVNVIGGTLHTLITVNGSTLAASITNAIYYGFYTIVIVYTSCELNLWVKVIVVAVCNFIGVFIVKTLEKKFAPSRLWKIEMTVRLPQSLADNVKGSIERMGIPCNYSFIGNWVAYNCYCSTKEQTKEIKQICKNLDGKISAYKTEALG